MKAHWCSEEQIIHLLQQAERDAKSSGVLCREHSITEPASSAGARGLAV
jgi:hypothetical protein